MNRRELLTAFLGLPIAMSSGCGIGTPRLPEQGQIVGASAGPGHRLRDGFRPKPASDAWTEVEVVIVGAGIAGLSAARRLKQAGVDDFVVLELEPEPGGTTRSGSSDVIAYPWGAHYLPTPLPDNADLVELVEELGIVEGREEDGTPIIAEQFLCRDPHERTFYKGIWYDGLYLHAEATEQDLNELQAFGREVDRWVGWRDDGGRRAFTIPVSQCSSDPTVMQLDQMTMADWLRQRRLTSRRLFDYVDLACRDDYGLTVEQTSAWAGLFYFASRVREPGRDSQAFITWPEGNSRIVADALLPHSRNRIESGWVVSNISPTGIGENPHVEVTAFRDSQNSSGNDEVRGWRADYVVFAAPPFLVPWTIPQLASATGREWSEFQFGSWLVANLHLNDRPKSTGFPPCWDNVIHGSPSLGYVTATHQRGMDYGPTVLTYYYPLCDDDPRKARERLLSLTWSEWADVVLTDLEQAHPEIRELTTRLDIMRWGHAMIRPVPGFISGAARTECQKSWRNIHFAHSAFSGVALFEEAFDRGNQAADEIIAQRSRSGAPS